MHLAVKVVTHLEESIKLRALNILANLHTQCCHLARRAVGVNINALRISKICTANSAPCQTNRRLVVPAIVTRNASAVFGSDREQLLVIIAGYKNVIVVQACILFIQCAVLHDYVHIIIILSAQPAAVQVITHALGIADYASVAVVLCIADAKAKEHFRRIALVLPVVTTAHQVVLITIAANLHLAILATQPHANFTWICADVVNTFEGVVKLNVIDPRFNWFLIFFLIYSFMTTFSPTNEIPNFFMILNFCFYYRIKKHIFIIMTIES